MCVSDCEYVHMSAAVSIRETLDVGAGNQMQVPLEEQYILSLFLSLSLFSFLRQGSSVSP